MQPVQAAAEMYIEQLSPDQRVGDGWLGKCIRHGNHFVECRVWAIYAHTVEFTNTQNVFLCHAYIAAQATRGVYTSVAWQTPKGLTCQQIAPNPPAVIERYP